MSRATIHYLHDKSLHGFPHICVGSFIQSMKHFFVFYLFILFLFLFYFTPFFWIFWKTQTIYYFFRTQDERIGWMTYLDTLASPPQAWMKLSRFAILADFFCMQCRIERMHLREFKHAMMRNEKLCKNINYPICKCRNG